LVEIDVSAECIRKIVLLDGDGAGFLADVEKCTNWDGRQEDGFVVVQSWVIVSLRIRCFVEEGEVRKVPECLLVESYDGMDLLLLVAGTGTSFQTMLDKRQSFRENGIPREIILTVSIPKAAGQSR
jgi:hypothetical protein